MRHSKALLLTTIITAAIITGCQSPMNQADNQSTQATTQPSSSQSQATATVRQATPEVLSRYDWTLINVVDSHNQPLTALTDIKDQVQLQFDQQNGQNLTMFTVGCNNMGGQYSLNSNVLNISDVRKTMMGCGELSGAESLLTDLMQGSSQLVLKGTKAPILTQITNDRSTLMWQGTLTAQAQYNQQGDTVYWEVSHQTQACPPGSTKTCLQVRPVTYDEQGIKTAVGEWRLYGGVIQGYTHDSSSDELLRLKRFVIDPSDVKGKQFAYVLDMVVESSAVQ